MSKSSPILCQLIEGGFFFGRINVDGAPYNLVVAPKAEGETTGVWHPEYLDVPAARSYFDGAANTVAMAEAGSPIAKWAQSLAIAGFTDWYLPSRDELELLYRHLKPTAESNYIWRSGDNPSSLPAGYPYTDELPAQTDMPDFREGGDQAMANEWYWSSTQSSRYYARGQVFDDGSQYDGDKAYEGRARAVRRFKAE